MTDLFGETPPSTISRYWQHAGIGSAGKGSALCRVEFALAPHAQRRTHRIYSVGEGFSGYARECAQGAAKQIEQPRATPIGARFHPDMV